MFRPLSDIVYKTLDYWNYRSGSQRARFDPSLASEIRRAWKKLDVQMMPHTFSDQNPIGVLSLLRLFKTACTHSDFSERLLTDTKFDAFRELKERLIFPPIRALLHHGLKYILDVDAWRCQVTRKLLQEQRNGDMLQDGCESRSLADGGDDVYLDAELPCLVNEETANALPDRQPFFQRGNEWEDRSESRALITEVTVIEETEVTSGTSEDFLQKRTKDPSWGEVT